MTGSATELFNGLVLIAIVSGIIWLLAWLRHDAEQAKLREYRRKEDADPRFAEELEQWKRGLRHVDR